jgi:hypothetical protein
MHPNTFLRTFWRMELRHQVFVAMSFKASRQTRFDNIIAPAIRNVLIDGKPLNPIRVDLSKSGDSILTEIVDGISHSQLIVADVSTDAYDPENAQPLRNGNVMYEVGIALACRQPSEVLIIKSDKDKMLFDISTVPYMELDFSHPVLVVPA